MAFAHLRPDLIRTDAVRRYLPIVGALAGVGVAIGLATAPASSLDAAVARTGIVALVPAAAPPLGVTARVLLALGVGAVIAALGFALRLRHRLPRRVLADPPVEIRRADAHPDCPPRRPIKITDLAGAPLPPPALPPVAAVEDPPLPEPVAPLPPHLSEQPFLGAPPRALPIAAPAALAEEPGPTPETLPFRPVFRPLREDDEHAPLRPAATAPIVRQVLAAGGNAQSVPAPEDEPVVTPIGRAAVTRRMGEIAAMIDAPAPSPRATAPASDLDLLLARLERAVAPAPPRHAVAAAAHPAGLDATLESLRRLAAG